MKRKYYAKWSANGNSTFGTLGEFSNKKEAIKTCREVVVGNQFCGGASGQFSVECTENNKTVLVFSETVTVKNDGSVELSRNHAVEGMTIVR